MLAASLVLCLLTDSNISKIFQFGQQHSELSPFLSRLEHANNLAIKHVKEPVVDKYNIVKTDKSEETE